MKHYNITSDQLETIENLISYYEHIKMEDLIKTKPNFILDDFQKLLKTCETIIREE